MDMISQAVDMVGPDDDGWTRLSEVGTALRRIDPGFDPAPTAPASSVTW